MATQEKGALKRTLIEDFVRKNVRETGYPKTNTTADIIPRADLLNSFLGVVEKREVVMLRDDRGYTLTPDAPEYKGRRPSSKQEIIDSAYRKSMAAGEDPAKLLTEEWKVTYEELDTARVNSEKPSPQRKTRPSRR